MSKGQKMKRTFHDNLILNRYLLSLFNQDNLEKFEQRLGDKSPLPPLYIKKGNKFVENWRSLFFIKIAPLFCKEGLGEI